MNTNQASFKLAVQQELSQRNDALFDGIRRYLTHPYQRAQTNASVIWQKGNCRLLDYGVEGEEKARMIFIPSLINRYYILDLKSQRSMVAYLRAQGIRPLVMDWNEPNQQEQSFSCDEYITQRLMPAIASLSHTSPLIAAGYCMGGLLALALAQLAPERVNGLVLMATPWNFHSQNFPRVKLDNMHAEKLCKSLARQKVISGDIIQTLFYIHNPWHFAQKFSAFAQLDSISEEAEEFVAIENWVNDNVDMPSAVAEQCLIHWVQENRPANGNWRINDTSISPDALKIPVFTACPTNDTIVPPDCAEPLLPEIKNCTTIRPKCGHVAMVAGAQAESTLWRPLNAWVHAEF
ncbi:MAG: alpha/beta fold hydrolase [Alphaproteobacteria bacterium]|nr:alpha/beta fold hydrolase [Alphaproteobacteria bacterium]